MSDLREDIDFRLFLKKRPQNNKAPFLSELSGYHAIRSGDVAKVKENIAKIRADFSSKEALLSDDPLLNARYHVIVSTAFTVGTCAEHGMNYNDAHALGCHYVRLADQTESIAKMIDLLARMQMDFADRMLELNKQTFISMHVSRCIDYIYEHLPEKITIETLAEYVGRHPAYLSKLFVSETGKTIHTFIVDTRIETAENMLAAPDLSYVDIALSLGFSSQSAFINVFRQKTGMTPRQYRSKYYNV